MYNAWSFPFYISSTRKNQLLLWEAKPITTTKEERIMALGLAIGVAIIVYVLVSAWEKKNKD